MKIQKEFVSHYSNIQSDLFGGESAHVYIRNLISDDKDGAPVYNLRMIEIKPDGFTPEHSHNYEHENYIIQGKGQVMINGKWYALKEGDVVFVPANTVHQYKNTGSDDFKFLCGIPNPQIQHMLASFE